jgi:hypothetical protein
VRETALLEPSPTGAKSLRLCRHGRVFSGVAVTDLPVDRAVTLARVQQRRIVSALR